MKKFWLISLLFAGLMFAGTNLVMAQQTLPAGGDSFESASLIQPGKYQSGSLDEETGLEKYYFIEGVKPGQEIKIKGVFMAGSHSTSNKIILYNEEMEELLNVDDINNSSVVLSASWLPNSDQSSYKYYFKIVNEGSDLWYQTESFTLEISLVDRYDAGSQTDAGDTIDKALAIAPASNYQSYLAGCCACSPYQIQEGGTDFKDFYKIAVKKGQTLNIEVVPPSEAEMELEIYNTKRQLLESETAENEGAILTTSLNVINDGDIFVAVICGDYCSSKLVAYTLNVTTASAPGEKPVIGEVACGEDSDCPVGLVCSDGQCVSECASDSECGKGLVCQEGVCVYNIFNDFYKQSEGEEGMWKGFPAIVSKTLFSGWRFWLSLVLIIIFYIYFAICLQTLAKKTNTSNGWLAWIPVANLFLMIQIAQKPLWWFILLLIPIVNIVIGIILWMKIAERRGKPNWWGILLIVPVVGIIVPGYLAFSGKEKIEITPPYTGTGTQEANKPVVGYQHPCKYCGKLIPPNSAICPFCGKANPLGPYRCPKCHEPIEKEWQVCPNCNQNLRIVCPHCGKITFFGDHCEDCGARLFVKCPHCGQEQPPLTDNCIKCGNPLKVEKR
ncbi:MAG: zinc ribbon domain-containing protein [Candidatus Paceibacterota bacterium]|nr:zinc ribbon domain-containing protein [Candidatus Paceibacterota bacterium]HQM35002.1 zinc ribbon domain-containing protein [Candidatus Paceibacterota bacterium]